MSVLDNITKRVTDTAKAAAKKSGGMVEVTKLNMNIGSEEEKVNKIYGEIGKILYSDYLGGEAISDLLAEYCEKINAIQRNIEEMRQKILELKNLKACPDCGVELEIDMAYCHKCGRKQEVFAPMEEGNGSQT